MCNKVFSLLLSVSLIAFVINPAWAQTKTTSPEKQAEFKKRVVEWGTNKSVAVKLKSGEKLDGRIAEIKDDLFAVQFVDKDKVTSHEIRYSDVNKISGKAGSKAGRIAGYTALGVLAGVGVAFLVVLGIWANN